MEKRTITQIPEDSLTYESIDRKFLDEEHITQEDIREYVQNIREKIQIFSGGQNEKSVEEKRMIILDALNYSNIYNDFLQRGGKTTAIAEMEDEVQQALARLRNAIFEECKKDLDLNEEDIVFIEYSLNNKKKDEGMPVVSAIKNAKGEKDVYRDVQPLHGYYRGVFKKAVERYSHLRDRSPYVIDIKSFDPDTGDVILKKEEIVDLFSVLNSFDRQKIDEISREKQTAFMLGIIRDAMEGAVYLHNNGLVLQDLKTANIGVVTERNKLNNKKGILFDVDGLTEEGTAMPNRIASPGFFPPETSGPVTAREMVYQFGKILEEVKSRKNFFLPENWRHKLETIIHKMTETDPQKRILIDYAYQQLGNLCGEMELRHEQMEIEREERSKATTVRPDSSGGKAEVAA